MYKWDKYCDQIAMENSVLWERKEGLILWYLLAMVSCT